MNIKPASNKTLPVAGRAGACGGACCAPLGVN